MAKSLKDSASKTRARANKSTEDTRKLANQLELELVHFKTGDKSIEFNIDLGGETVWANQADIADLFEIDRTVVSRHIKNIFEDNELDGSSTCAKFAHVGSTGQHYETTHYNLDVILSVGYRVNGPKATRFRKWATQTLKAYIVDGFAINEGRLRSDPAAAHKLAAKLREIRAEEVSVYASVREFFKVASTDYDKDSPKCRKFYATLQDKFHYAITGKTSSEIIISRADNKKPAMGLVTFSGNMPKLTDAQIGKNYLEKDELYALHIISEQFLLYIEGMALREKKMTMDDLAKKLDSLLEFNEYPVFKGYKDYLKDRAVKHASAEYAVFLGRLKKEETKKL